MSNLLSFFFKFHLRHLKFFTIFFKIIMYWSSADFGSHKMFNIIMSTKSVFLNFDLRRGLQPASPAPPSRVRPWSIWAVRESSTCGLFNRSYFTLYCSSPSYLMLIMLIMVERAAMITKNKKNCVLHHSSYTSTSTTYMCFSHFTTLCSNMHVCKAMCFSMAIPSAGVRSL